MMLMISSQKISQVQSILAALIKHNSERFFVRDLIRMPLYTARGYKKFLSKSLSKVKSLM